MKTFRESQAEARIRLEMERLASGLSVIAKVVSSQLTADEENIREIDGLVKALRDKEHYPRTGRGSDGENCIFCSAWSDAEWSAPCTGRGAALKSGSAE